MPSIEPATRVQVLLGYPRAKLPGITRRLIAEGAVERVGRPLEGAGKLPLATTV